MTDVELHEIRIEYERKKRFLIGRADATLIVQLTEQILTCRSLMREMIDEMPEDCLDRIVAIGDENRVLLALGEES